MESVIRLLIVDDHALFRQGVARLLAEEPGFQVVGQCGSVEDAVAAVQQSPVDVVLLDIDLPGRPAADIFSLLPPETACAVLLVTAVTDHGEIARLLRKGARGVFSKSTDASRLPDAIRQVFTGENWIDRVYLEAFIAAAASGLPESDGPLPSSRERDVLSLVGRGLSNKQIADELGFSEPAVKAALQRLFRKFGVGSRAQLVAVSTELTRRTG
jgi:two-component system nitrate/nitrite response regulator NarL